LVLNVRFGRHLVDGGRQRLLRDGVVVPLEPKVFEVLRYLVEHHERVVTKEELLEHVWQGEAVTEAVLPNNVAVLRRALGQARGQAEPIETVHGRGYRFAAEVRREGTGDPGDETSGSPAGLVGRGPVLVRLQARLAEAQAGSGRLVVISGAAGIGKTCLAEQFVAAAAAAGASVWTGRCHDGAGAPVLWPWLQALRGCAEELDAAELKRLQGHESALLGPWLGEPQAGPEPRRIELEPAAQRFQRLDALARFLIRSATGRLRVVWLEDAHLADAWSLQLLEQLSAQLGRSRLLLLVTLRADELPVAPAAREPWLKLFRLRGADHVRLEGLGQAEAGQWLATLRSEPLSAGLLQALWTETDGNPFFLRDALPGLPVDAVATGSFEPRLSSSAHAVLRRRLQGVSERLRHVLQAASVVGFELNLALLQRIAGLDHAALLDALDEAAELGLIQPVEGETGGYRFGQRLLRHTLYVDLPSSRRAQLHLAVAGALAEQAAGAAEQLRNVAYHLHRALPAADAQQAIDYATRAALAAERGGAHLDAAAMYRLALEASAYDPQPGALRRCRLQVGQGRALWLAGQHAAARAVLLGALDAARRAQDGTALAEAAWMLAELASDPLSVPLVVHSLLREALGALPQGHDLLRGTLLGLWAATRAEDPEASARGFEQALAALTKLPGSEAAQCRVECARLASGLYRSEHARCAGQAQALEQRLEALQLAGGGEPGRASLAVEWLGCETQRLHCLALVSAGAMLPVERAWGEWGGFAERGQLPAMHAAWLIFGAEQALARGRLGLSATRAAQLESLGLPLGEGVLGFWHRVFEVRLDMLRGQPFLDAAAFADLERRLERGEDWRRVVLAWLAARAGGRELALRLLDECLPVALARSVAQPWELCALAECVARVGHREGALALRDALEAALQRAPLEQAVGPLFQFFGSPQRHVGVLEQFLGRGTRARARLEAAVAANERMGLATHAIGCRFSLAQLLLEHGQRKLRVQGNRLLTAALEQSAALGINVRDAPLVTGAPDPDELALH
jgi:DNA-binding winged helix-turn-helix (wHTH) protein